MNREYFAQFLNAEAGQNVRTKFTADVLHRLVHNVEIPEHFAGQALDERGFIDALSAEAAECLAPLRQSFLCLRDEIKECPDETASIRAKLALEVTPLFLSTLHLISFVCGNSNNESRYAMETLKVHAQDIAHGQPRNGRVELFQTLLQDNGLATSVDNLIHSSTDSRISDGAFNLPAKLVTFGHFPQSLTGEILGINLLLRQPGTLPPLELLSTLVTDNAWFLDLGASSHSQHQCLEDSIGAVQAYVDDFGDKGRVQILKGYFWILNEVKVFCGELLNLLDAWKDPREAARQLIANRTFDACQYHRKTKLAKVSMRELLDKDDTDNFLKHLASSAFVTEGKPESSPLLNKLIAPTGKMFRIFDGDDIAILNRWIKGMPYESDSLTTPAYKQWQDDGELALLEHSSHNLVPFSKNDVPIRTRYYRLLRSETLPSDEAWAKDYAKHWLASAAKEGDCPLPSSWSAGTLVRWLQHRHQLSNQQFDEGDDVPEKDAVVADILALAPLTMIDGAWLSGFCHPQVATSSFGFRLFETFYDELGNGVERQNHPVIYRQLLNKVYGEFPPTASVEFSEHSAFDNKDFALPVYWLSIGRFPLTFTPEILGLNLAMELSGVGGGYRKTHKALVKYRFPTLFVDLHNTIDNTSTGHSAWAAAAIDAYLSTYSTDAQVELWQRIRTGYMSLSQIPQKSIFHKIKERMKSIL
ncbi:iron-containing redox enzyme family protein [Reinekea sp. G2M2-21]|uniref:iron-containing redox enzyme family protein n=1 Tax=Reinekea sp. G2M2-21 TaxID=2788942 RepID=UPI0018AB7170|nr:iron-containing redox enzyme family protein [Reinekea sp. G2M2-21]